MRHLSLAAQRWIGLVLLAGGGVIAFALVSASDAQARTELNTGVFWVLLIASAVAHAFPVIAPRHQAYHTTQAFLMAAVLLLSWPAVVVIVLAIHATEWLRRRRPWYIQLYNVASYVLSAGAARVVLGMLDGRPFVPSDSRALLVALAAAAAYVLVNHALTAMVLRFARQVRVSESGLFGVESLGIDGALLVVGIGIGAAWLTQPVLALLAVVPLALIARGLRVAGDEPASHRDPLSGMYNARHFSEAIDLELSRARHVGQMTSVMIVAIDDVPRIVHAHGRATLDFLAAAIGARLSATVRDFDVVARLGEGRFGVLLAATDRAAGERLAELVGERLQAEPFRLPTTREPVGVSVSVAVSNLEPGDTPRESVAQVARTAERASVADSTEWSVPRVSLPLYEVAVIVPGVVATALVVWLAPLPDPWIALAVVGIMGLSELLAFDLYDRTSFSISFAPILAAGLLAGPTGTLVATWSVALLRGALRHSRWDKVAFNAAIFSLFGLAATWIATANGALPMRAFDLPVLAVATLAASALYYAHTFFIAAAVAIDLEADPRRVWERNFRWLFPHYLVLGAMGLGLAVATVELGPLGSALFLAPPLMMRFVLKQYTERTSSAVERLESTNAELVSTSALLRRRGEELALLSDLGQLAASEPRTANLPALVMSRCVPALGDVCTVVWTSASGTNSAISASDAGQAEADRLRAMSSGEVLDFAQIAGGRESDAAWLAVPLAGADRSLGCLLAWIATPLGFDERQARLELMGEVARRLALVLERDALLEEAASVDALRAVDRAKSDFIATTAHELRTPLTSLQGYTELLRNDVEPALRDRWLRILHVEAAQLGQVVDQLLDVSRLESGKAGAERRPFVLGATVSDVLAGFREQAVLTGHTLGSDTPNDLPCAVADPRQIERVLRNLVSNAMKYSPDGGPVRVAAFESAPDELEVCVEDRGMGIPPEWLDRLFARFERIDLPERASIRGIGLGLYIARQLVELNGGRIWATSPGLRRGACFHFTLPASDGPVAALTDDD